MSNLEKWNNFRKRRDEAVDKYVAVRNMIYKASVYAHNIAFFSIIRILFDTFAYHRSKVN